MNPFLSDFFHEVQRRGGIFPGFCRSFHFKRLASLLRVSINNMQPEICPNVNYPLIKELLIFDFSYDDSKTVLSFKVMLQMSLYSL